MVYWVFNDRNNLNLNYTAKDKMAFYMRRPWGRMWKLVNHKNFWVKFLVVGGQTSLQSHNHRTEWQLGVFKVTPKNKHYVLPGAYFRIVRGKGVQGTEEDDKHHEWHVGFYRVKPKEKHRLLRGVYLEFVHGSAADEGDIVRYEDDYSRTGEDSEQINEKEKIVVVSGGFDPIHVGHLEMFEEAKALGDKLVVVINCDAWLIRKKGKYFMNQNDRATLIKGIKHVDDVFILETDRDDVGEAIEKIRPHIFANGGDRKDENAIPEAKICKELGVEMVFNIGKSGKVRSSSELLEDYIKKDGKKTARGDFSWQKNV